MEFAGKRTRDYFEAWSLFTMFQFFKMRDRLGLGQRVPRIVDRDVHGFTMRLDTSLFFDWYVSKFAHFYEANELVWVQEHLDAGDVFLDIGSNVGLYSLFASRAVGATGKVVAVDADAGIQERLIHNLTTNNATNVLPLQVGVSDTRETAMFSVPLGPMRAASSLIIDGGGQLIPVECYPLLDILDGENIRRIKGMKLDIEGMEFRVLRRFLLDAPHELRPEWLITEYFPGRVKASGGDVLRLLTEFGYSMVKRHALNCIFSSAPGTAISPGRGSHQ